jgi:hypothetical protein
VGQNAEELSAAWTAAVRRQSKEPPDGCQDAGFHPFGGDALQIQVTAAPTVSVAGENDGYSASVKPKIASLASPGLEPDRSA